jgi:alpha-beta hydrolase superfamily lysophospholipase
MKMKLAQRIALSYYKAKFKALSFVSPRKAAESAFELFCTPYSGKPKRKTPPIFHKGEKISFNYKEFKLNGWRWKAEQPNGKKILIVHGFDSCSYRFDRYIIPFITKGFEVIAFDAQGHGTSSGKTINALHYSQAIARADELFGNFYGIMAHSLGGLAAALAFEKLADQQQRKLVLIAPTTETKTAITNFFGFVPVPQKVQQEFNTLIEEVGKQPLAYYSLQRIIRNIHAPVLWVHDEEDKVCPYEDTIPIQQLKLSNVDFFTTKGLGHSGIYRQDNVFKKILDFLVDNTCAE